MKVKKLSALLILLLTVSLMAEYIPLKIKLTSLERLIVMSLLPNETNIVTWKILIDLKNEVGLTEAEQKQIGLKITDTGMIAENGWNAIPEKEIVFGEIAEKMIKDALTKLNEQSKLKFEHLSLCEKFEIDTNILKE